MQNKHLLILIAVLLIVGSAVAFIPWQPNTPNQNSNNSSNTQTNMDNQNTQGQVEGSRDTQNQPAPEEKSEETAQNTNPNIKPEFNIQVTKQGSGEEKTTKGDTVAIHYTGKLVDGTIFDSSYNRNQPLEFTLGSGQVIPGFEKGVQDMSVGEKRIITIPPELGYGNQAVGNIIPANSTLIFEIELVSIS